MKFDNYFINKILVSQQRQYGTNKIINKSILQYQ